MQKEKKLFETITVHYVENPWRKVFLEAHLTT